jgi:hypothetical protein
MKNQYIGIISKGMLLKALDREGQTMADQSNPWDSAPAADSAAQSADAWGSPPSAPTDGGGTDWLNSAPAPQPEHFNIMDPFHKTLIPLDSWVTHGIDWIVVHFRPLFQGIRVPVDYILSAFQQLLLGMPAPVAIVLFALIAWQISSVGMGAPRFLSDCHRCHRRVVAGDGHPGAGPDRPAVLYADRPAAGDLAGA